MTIAKGVNKSVRIKKETVWGALAAGTGDTLRRVSSDLSLTKDTYESKEIRTDLQVADMRHGMKKVEGKVEGELSPTSYTALIASALRKDAAAVAGTVAQTTIAATATGFSRSGGSFLADGHTVGSVVRVTGFTTTGASNNAKNFLITSLSATVMDGLFVDGSSTAVKASGDSVSIVPPGKSTFVPLTGHTSDSYSIEHLFSDVAQSELFVGCKVNNVDVDLPATGMSKISLGFLGKDMLTSVAAQIATVNAAPTTGVLAAANGALVAAGTKQTALSALKFSINGNMSTEPVIGSNVAPDVFEGRVTVKGEFSVYFENATLRDAFIAETEISLFAVFASGSGAASDFVAFCFPRVKLGAATKDDGEKGLLQTIPFTALLGDGTAGFKPTTLWVQDSAAP